MIALGRDMMELSAVARIHRVTRGKSRMASYSKTIPVCCGSSFTIGGHFDVSSANRTNGSHAQVPRNGDGGKWSRLDLSQAGDLRQAVGVEIRLAICYGGLTCGHRAR